MPTTTNNGWPTPADTDLVKNGADAIRDLGNAIDTTLGVYTPIDLGAWTSYTPTVRQGTTNVTPTISYAKFKQIGKIVFVNVSVKATTTGSASTIINISVPSGKVPLTDGLQYTIGTFGMLDAGTAFYHGYCTYVSSSGGFVGVANGGGNAMGANSPGITVGNNDEFYLSVVYEVA
jgi:hypothetical protein